MYSRGSQLGSGLCQVWAEPWALWSRQYSLARLRLLGLGSRGLTAWSRALHITTCKMGRNLIAPPTLPLILIPLVPPLSHHRYIIWRRGPSSRPLRRTLASVQLSCIYHVSKARVRMISEHCWILKRTLVITMHHSLGCECI